jgi:hypothetical protein
VEQELRFEDQLMKQRSEFKDDFKLGLITIDEYKQKVAELEARRNTFFATRQGGGKGDDVDIIYSYVHPITLSFLATGVSNIVRVSRCTRCLNKTNQLAALLLPWREPVLFLVVRLVGVLLAHVVLGPEALVMHGACERRSVSTNNTKPQSNLRHLYTDCAR